MRALLILMLGGAVVACAPGHKMGGLSEPGLYTSPPSYLETVGLGKHTKDDVLSVLGPPYKTFENDGQEMWTYMLSEEGARRRFTYIFEGEILYDVQYNESGMTGPYDGMTAREAQAK